MTSREKKYLGLVLIGVYAGTVLSACGDFGQTRPAYLIDAKLIATAIIMGLWLISAGYMVGNGGE